MPKSYVLIDYENVQPKNLAPLKHPDFHIHIFIGASQKNLESKVAIALQPFGANAQYIRISGNGKNAADFHIAFYTGQLSAREQGSTFYIVSKDKGFDPLVKHLETKCASAKRVTDINKIPVLKTFSGNTTNDKVDKIITNLRSRGKSIPKTEPTLCNSINSLFGGDLKEAEMKNIIGRMKNLGHLKIESGKIQYTFE